MLAICVAPTGLDNVLQQLSHRLRSGLLLCCPLGHDKDTPSGCNNRSPLRKRWVKRNTYCFSPVGAAQPG